MLGRHRKEKLGQYLFFEQWKEIKDYCNNRGIQIVGDIPIYVSFDSADVWAHREIFKLDGEQRPIAVAGVPPDYFSSNGQLWVILCTIGMLSGRPVTPGG